MWGRDSLEGVNKRRARRSECVTRMRSQSEGEVQQKEMKHSVCLQAHKQPHS